MYIKGLIVLVMGLGLSACALEDSGSTTSQPPASLTPTAVAAPATVAAFQAIGATQVMAADFASRIVGKEMTELGGGWTWTINADGTHQSFAADGSWGGVDGNWRLDGDAYCIDGDDPSCRTLWMVGSYLRLADTAGTLSGWTVIVP